MANIVLPFLMSMILGRTIDLTTYEISGSVYDDAVYKETTASSLKATYHVLQDDSLPYESFELPMDIVLRIKSNFLTSSSGSMGLDGLLKDTSWKYNSAVVGVTIIQQTVERSLSEGIEPLSGWQQKVKKSQTHYVDKLTYGGWCVVLFRFKCDIPSDVQAVRKTLMDTLGLMGNLGPKANDLWKKANKAMKENQDIRGKVQISTHIYSSVPLNHEITSLDDLMDVLKKFPDTVGPLGHPFFMNLKPLYDLDKEYPEVKKHTEMVPELEKLDKMVDDVKATKVNLMRWLQESLTLFSDEDEKKIYTLLNNINSCIRAFSRVSSDASLFKTMDRDDLEYAFHLYLNNLERGAGTYNLAYIKLREEIDAECEDTFLHKVRGLLKVYENEMVKEGTVKGGLKECQETCADNKRCRSIGYAEHVSELDIRTGLYKREEKQCWIYFRSTSTAIVHTPNGLSGDMAVYDRNCYSQ